MRIIVTLPRFMSNLKDCYLKSQEKRLKKGHEELLEDEIFSPTFKELLILWCLDKVKPNLLEKKKNNTYLLFIYR